jgi:subtilisin family serine protease
LVTDDLKKVIRARNPTKVSVLIESEPGESSTIASTLTDLGIGFTRVDARGKGVFQVTITPDQVYRFAASDRIAVIDHSPTYLPQGVVVDEDSPNIHGVFSPTETAGEAVGVDLLDVTQALNVDRAWESAGVRGEDVRIGMVDTPVNTRHRAISHAVEGEAGPVGSEDHGSWVASSLVARETDVRRGTIRGVAPEAELYVYGALSGGGATATEIIEGIEWCIENDCDIINLSLGGGHSTVMHNIVIETREAGVLPVSSAGNSGPGKATCSCPAHHAETLAVGSASLAGPTAAFSSRGPGWTDDPTKPEVTSYGGAAFLGGANLQVSERVLGAGASGDGVYLLGTSMASPQAAGVAALRLSALRNPGGA